MFRRCAGEHLLLKDALNSMAASMSDSANNVPMRHQTVTIVARRSRATILPAFHREARE